MKRIFSLILLSITLAFGLLFSHPKIIQAYTKCYSGTSQIGDMHTWDSYFGYPFAVNGLSATVEFFVKDGNVANNEVFLKLGTSNFVPYASKQKVTGGTRYFAHFSTPNTTVCGPTWANVMYRNIRTGRNQYCNDLTTTYKTGLWNEGFLNSTCLNTPQGCSIRSTSARQVGLREGYSVWATIPSGKICSNYKFCIFNGKITNCGNLVTYDAPEHCQIISGSFNWPIFGVLTAFISDVAEVHVTDSDAPIQLYNYVSDRYCGGNL